MSECAQAIGVCSCVLWAACADLALHGGQGVTINEFRIFAQGDRDFRDVVREPLAVGLVDQHERDVFFVAPGAAAAFHRPATPVPGSATSAVGDDDHTDRAGGHAVVVLGRKSARSTVDNAEFALDCGGISESGRHKGG